LKLDATVAASILSRGGITGALLEEVDKLGLVCRIEPADVFDLLRVFRDSEHAFNIMVDLFGVDTGENVDVVYHLRSIPRDEDVFVKAAHPYGGDLASVWEIYPAAAFPERECAEMFGLTLSGNPNPKHLLVTEGVEPLLLKSVGIRGPEEVRNR
jgi:NADH:ubiquinone oxidoreductase subunit C